MLGVDGSISHDRMVVTIMVMVMVPKKLMLVGDVHIPWMSQGLSSFQDFGLNCAAFFPVLERRSEWWWARAMPF